jgi:Bromodomain
MTRSAIVLGNCFQTHSHLLCFESNYIYPIQFCSDEKEFDASKKDKKIVAVKFPLNQLTWQELARMIVTTQVMTDQGRGREDIQQALRGSRQPNFRIAKNVVRYIRYRLAARLKGGVDGKGNGYKEGGVLEDDRLHGLYAHSLSASASASDSSLPLSLPHSPPFKKEELDDAAVYGSESEVINALVVASSDPAYSETYQRCCKVLVKIANLGQAKHFFWEIDSVMFPDYYESIKRPMMIANVAASLVRQSYGNESMTVAESFYRDMRQVVLNCFAYNTEVTAVHAQAQKIYQVQYSAV